MTIWHLHGFWGPVLCSPCFHGKCLATDLSTALEVLIFINKGSHIFFSHSVPTVMQAACRSLPTGLLSFWGPWHGVGLAGLANTSSTDNKLSLHQLLLPSCYGHWSGPGLASLPWVVMTTLILSGLSRVLHVCCHVVQPSISDRAQVPECCAAFHVRAVPGLTRHRTWEAAVCLSHHHQQVSSYCIGGQAPRDFHARAHYLQPQKQALASRPFLYGGCGASKRLI